MSCSDDRSTVTPDTRLPPGWSVAPPFFAALGPRGLQQESTQSSVKEESTANAVL